MDKPEENLNRISDEKKDIPSVSAGDYTEAGSFSESLDLTGHQIGRYKLLKLLGEGGFGVVYLAEQNRPIKRLVALKAVKPGMDSRQVLYRFESERQALAVLDHPNIARIYDAGAMDNARPFFVMEYIQGQEITDYCDTHNLSVEDRLNLFLMVCHAVQHAHQKGIIHRDLKSSNIIVTEQDNQAVPKVIDFGVAKAMGQSLTEHTVFTGQGQPIGTPAYMSPEQAGMGVDVDTRTDIYSLGVLLYELLTGSLPFDLKKLHKSQLGEIQRVIREEDPPRPSTQLTRLAGEDAKKIADMRSTEVCVLARRLRNELEWIPLKAMRKDPSQRYRSADELADDIHNYLDGLPLKAGPESYIYRIKKFLRRHRLQAAALAAIVLMVISTVTFYEVRLITKIRTFSDEGNRLLQTGSYQEAEGAFMKILAFDKDNREAQLGISRALDQDEIIRDLTQVQNCIEQERFDIAVALAVSLKQRFNKDQRVAEALHNAKGITDLRVNFKLGIVTNASLQKITDDPNQPVENLKLENLLSAKGIEVEPGWHWLDLIYKTESSAIDIKNLRYLVFITRSTPYLLDIKKVKVGDSDDADYKNIEGALAGSRPGNIISLAPGEHLICDNCVAEYSIPNITIESEIPENPAIIKFDHIKLISTYDVHFKNLVFSGIGFKQPWKGVLNFFESACCTVTGCIFDSALIDVYDSDGILICSNEFINYIHHRLYIKNSQRVIVRNNVIKEESRPGVRSVDFDTCRNILVYNNDIARSAEVGMRLRANDSAIVIGNNIYNNPVNNIYLEHTFNSVLAHNRCSNGGKINLSMFDSFRNMLIYNDLAGSEIGIGLKEVSNALFQGNTISDSNTALFISGGKTNIIQNNIFSNNNNLLVKSEETADNTLPDLESNIISSGNAAREDHFAKTGSFKDEMLAVCDRAAESMLFFNGKMDVLLLPGITDNELNEKILSVFNKACDLGPPVISTKYISENAIRIIQFDKILSDPNKFTEIAQQFNGHYYFLSPVMTTWQTSARICESLGGHLATVNSRQEHEWIIKTFSSDPAIWLGASRNNDKWKWCTGEPWDFTSLPNGRPNVSGEGSLLLIKNQWEDYAPETYKRFLIEWDR